MFYTRPKKDFCVLVTFIFSFANAFNLDQSKNLSFSTKLSTTEVHRVELACFQHMNGSLAYIMFHKQGCNILLNVNICTVTENILLLLNEIRLQ